MSDLLSAQLLREMEDNLSGGEDDPINIGDIEVQFRMIEGLREESSLVWAFEEECLYYKNSYSRKTGLEACKCCKKGCKARLYIREDGTAFRKVHHASNHGSMYKDFKYAHCFNKMKQRAATAPASMTTFQIYQEVLLE